MWEPGENNIIFPAGTEGTFLQQNQSLCSPVAAVCYLLSNSAKTCLPQVTSELPLATQGAILPSSSKTSAESDLIDPTLSSLNACLLLSWYPKHFWFCLPFPGSASSVYIPRYLRNCFLSLWGPCPGQSHPFCGGDHYSMLWTPNPTPLVLTFLAIAHLSPIADMIFLKLYIFQTELIIFPQNLLFLLLIINFVSTTKYPEYTLLLGVSGWD